MNEGIQETNQPKSIILKVGSSSVVSSNVQKELCQLLIRCKGLFMGPFIWCNALSIPQRGGSYQLIAISYSDSKRTLKGKKTF